MLTKQVVTDQITVLEDGQIQVREDTRILEDGEVLSHSYHRYVVGPGQRVADTRVAAIAAVVHTPAVVQAFRARQLKA